MPLRLMFHCKGRAGLPCRFSTSVAGRPECVTKDLCVLCRVADKNIRKSVIRALALLFILDYDIYNIAVSRLPFEIQDGSRERVRRMLQSMYHAPTITARRAKILGAVDQIVNSLSQHLPTLLQLFALSGQSVAHAHAVQVRTQIPQEVFEKICNYFAAIVGDSAKVRTSEASEICRYIVEDSTDIPPLPVMKPRLRKQKKDES